MIAPTWSRIALCAGLAACGGPGAPATPAPAAAPDAGVRAIDPALVPELAAGLEEVLATMAAITDGAADCPTMARQLGELFDRSAPLFELARGHGQDPEAGPALVAALDARAAVVQPLVERIARELGRCQLDPDVAAVMERMPTL